MPNPVSFFDVDGGNHGTDACWRQVSTRRQLISWIERLPPTEARSVLSDQNKLAIQPILKIVERNSVMLLSHTRYMMARILPRHCDAKFPNSIPFSLYISRSLHHFVHLHQKLISDSLEIVSLCGGDDIAEQKEDFAFLDNNFGKTLTALDEDVKFLVGEASVWEGKL